MIWLFVVGMLALAGVLAILVGEIAYREIMSEFDASLAREERYDAMLTEDGKEA